MHYTPNAGRNKFSNRYTKDLGAKFRLIFTWITWPETIYARINTTIVQPQLLLPRDTAIDTDTLLLGRNINLTSASQSTLSHPLHSGFELNIFQYDKYIAQEVTCLFCIIPYNENNFPSWTSAIINPRFYFYPVKQYILLTYPKKQNWTLYHQQLLYFITAR